MPGPDPNQLVLLAATRTEFEGRVMASALEAEGIPVEVFGASASTLGWEGGYATMAKVMVPREHLARAAEVVRESRRRSIDLDWNSVDVGEPEEGTAAPRAGGSRIAGLSPIMWRVRTLGFALLAGSLFVSQAGPRMALPALVMAFVLTWAAEPGRPTRAQPEAPRASVRR